MGKRRSRDNWWARRRIIEAKEIGLKLRGGKWYRKKKDAPWEEMVYDYALGWLSWEEIFHLRRTLPRIAP
jgi:hypothetical protein